MKTKITFLFATCVIALYSCKKDNACAVCHMEIEETILAKTTVTKGNDTTFCDNQQKASYAAVNTYQESFTKVIQVSGGTSSAEGVRKVSVVCSK